MAPPTMLDRPEVLSSLVEAVRKGVPPTTAARAARIAPQTLSAWLNAAESGIWPGTGTPVAPDTLVRIRDFAEQIGGAQAEHEAMMAQAVTDAATIPNEKTGLPDWRAGAWYLNNARHTREEWRQHREMTVTQQGSVSHEHRLVEGMSEPEILASVDAEWRELATPPSLPAPVPAETDTPSGGGG